MSKALLVRYIRTILEDRDARVPTQLIDPEDLDKEGEEKTDDVKEFSGAGAVAGYTAPLGASPNAIGRQKNKKRQKNK